MRDDIHVSTSTLENDIAKLKSLYDDWGATEAPPYQMDTRESEDDVNLQSESKTMENLMHQVTAARRVKKYFYSLIEATADYLTDTKNAFNRADNG